MKKLFGWIGGWFRGLMVGYFHNLFSSVSCHSDPILRSVHRKVTDAHNNMLMQKVRGKGNKGGSFLYADG